VPAAETSLFEDLAPPTSAQLRQAQLTAARRRSQGPPRLRQLNRSQIELRASDLESLLAEDHRARLVWGYVVHQDLSRLFDAVRARGSNAGRAAIDPQITTSTICATTSPLDLLPDLGPVQPRAPEPTHF
jgi:hypothetical protein